MEDNVKTVTMEEVEEFNEADPEEKVSWFENLKRNKGEYLKKAGIIALGATAMAVGALIVFGREDEEEDESEQEYLVKGGEMEAIETTATETETSETQEG